jgi:hypothetical protein
MKEQQEEKLLENLSDISEQLCEINKNLAKIAKFFEKWTVSTGVEPMIAVEGKIYTA